MVVLVGVLAFRLPFVAGRYDDASLTALRIAFALQVILDGEVDLDFGNYSTVPYSFDNNANASVCHRAHHQSAWPLLWNDNNFLHLVRSLLLALGRMRLCGPVMHVRLCAYR